jgi:predicted nucleic acid-binding Zn ribbon protein
MKRTDQEHLLNEILTGDENSDFRRASLELALQKNRRRQRHQTLLRFGATMAVTALLVWKFVLPAHGPAKKSQAMQLVNSSSITTPASESKVKIINDDELLALFPNRPVALIGKPGHQQLIFLDEPNPHSDGAL